MSPEFGATVGDLPDRRRDAALPARTGRAGRAVDWSSATPRSRACSAPTATPEPGFNETSSSTWHRSSRASPARAGRRTASRWERRPRASATPTASAVQRRRPDARTVDGRAAKLARQTARSRSPPSPLHQHLEPVGDGRPPGCWPRRPSSAACARRRGSRRSLAPGLAGGDRLPRARRPDAVPRASCGFDLVGYGCTTCIGNSGPLPDDVARRVDRRRPRGRRGALGQPQLRGPHPPAGAANYLASPPLVVAYALAGTVDIDLDHRAARRRHRRRARLSCSDIWPSSDEVERVLLESIDAEHVRQRVRHDLRGRRALARPAGARGRAVRLGPRLHLRARATVLRAT